MLNAMKTTKAVSQGCLHFCVSASNETTCNNSVFGSFTRLRHVNTQKQFSLRASLNNYVYIYIYIYGISFKSTIVLASNLSNLVL